jgi:hypothetical protein
MKHTLIIIAALSLGACDKLIEKTPPPKPDNLVIGNGQTIKAPGVSVLMGPLTINMSSSGNGKHFGSIPFTVLDAPSFTSPTRPAMYCLVFDDKHRLAASVGGMLPPKLHGGEISANVPDTFTSGTMQCAIGQTDPGDPTSRAFHAEDSQ